MLSLKVVFPDDYQKHVSNILEIKNILQKWTNMAYSENNLLLPTVQQVSFKIKKKRIAKKKKKKESSID